MKPSCSVSDLVREVKKSSNHFINEKRFLNSQFSWQQGFGAFSFGRFDLNRVIAYVDNQKEHHKKTPFREEYQNLLNEFEVEYEDQYLFDWLD